LAAVAPGGYAAAVDHLPLDVEASDQERVARVLQVLEDRARVLPHQDRVRRVIVDPEVVSDTGLLGDPVERDPGPRSVADVVVKVVAGGPARHRTLLDAIDQSAVARRPQQRD